MRSYLCPAASGPDVREVPKCFPSWQAPNPGSETIEEIEREGSDVVCNTGLPLRSGDGGTDRMTTIEVAVCENNWVRSIVGVKRVDRRRMDDLREEIGVQMSSTGRFVK